MTDWTHIFTAFSTSATGALVSAMWEGAVLAAAVALCMRLSPALSAAARSLIWLNVFFLIALLHFAPVFARPDVHAGSVVPAIRLDLRWSVGIAVAWLVLSLWRAAQLLVGALHLRRLARRSVPVEVDPELRTILNDGPRGRSAQLCVSAEMARPSVLGFFHPRILIPPALLKQLTQEELRQVVLHEMEHLRRADDWTNLVQKIGLLLFPLNPVLLWVERKLCAERELACDDRVMESGGGRKSYALCLTHLAELALLQRGFSLVLGAFERRPELVRRVERILSRPPRSMGRKAALCTTGGLLSGALGCALVLAHSPQLVSFAPAVPPYQANAAGSSGALELSRELGGTPQLVKAVVPSPQAVPQVRKAVLKHTIRQKAPAMRTAAQQQPPREPQVRQAMVVMAEWMEIAPAPRVVISVVHSRRVQGPDAEPLVAIPAVYATVATPDGWIIVQI